MTEYIKPEVHYRDFDWLTIDNLRNALNDAECPAFSLGVDGKLQISGVRMDDSILTSLDKDALLAIVERINDKATALQCWLREELEDAA